MESTFTLNHHLEKPNIGQKKDKWGTALNSNFDTIDHLLTIGQAKTLGWTFPYVDFSTTYNILGFDIPTVVGVAFSSGSPVATTVGCSKLRFNVNTGTTLTGSILVTGTSRHSSTGALILGDTETVPVTALGTYVGRKFWTGPVTVSTTDLVLTSLDLHQISWYDNRGRRFAVRGIRHQVQTRAVGASSAVSLTRAVRTGAVLTLTEVLTNLVDVSSTSATVLHWDKLLEIPSLDVTGRDEGIICTLAAVVGSAGDLRDLRLDLHYENRTTQ